MNPSVSFPPMTKAKSVPTWTRKFLVCLLFFFFFLAFCCCLYFFFFVFFFFFFFFFGACCFADWFCFGCRTWSEHKRSSLSLDSELLLEVSKEVTKIDVE